MLWSRADGLSQMNLFYVLCQRHVCGETLLENKSILSSNMKTRGITMTIIRFPHINIIIHYDDMEEKYEDYKEMAYGERILLTCLSENWIHTPSLS